ncbi:MAG: DNA-directed RNA polymerase subunit omega [Chthoniobacterales bacterium]
MNSALITEALKIVPEQKILVNMVSYRVRRLSTGSRPMVDVPFGSGLADTALHEIIQGKLSYKPAKVQSLS